jgi:hypothetical protein
MSTDVTVKNQLQSLIATANATTGEEDSNLTDAVSRLVEGFGQGDDISKYMTQLNYVFRNAIFPTNTEFVLNPTAINGYFYMQETFENVIGLRKIKIIITDAEVGMYGFSYGSGSIEIIDFSEWSNCTIADFRESFRNNTGLREIIGVITISDAYTLPNYSNVFFGCSALEEIRFSPSCLKLHIAFNFSPLLSDASMQSIIDGLADLTGATSQKISFHSTTLNKLTDGQLDQILAKNWTI